MLRSRRGQIVIPAMLMFPALFLFVYLIYETANLSRQKIRHQFAIDAAAFVEMANYSDFLNRTAYVNGAFPMRIFEEGYDVNFKSDCEGKQEHCNQEEYAQMLFRNGAFPSLSSGDKYTRTEPTGGKWAIRYQEPRFAGKNANPPDLNELPHYSDGSKVYELFVEEDSEHYWHPFDLATEIYKLYVQVYSLLGSVEDAQFKVLHKLATEGEGGHAFLRKSYWLNTGDEPGDAVKLAQSFDKSLGDFEKKVHPKCLKKLAYWGNVLKTGPGVQPFVPWKTSPDVDLADTKVTSGIGCAEDGEGGTGLFQMEFLDRSMYDPQSRGGTLGTGLQLDMPWSLPGRNFFNVDFNALMGGAPKLHTTVSLAADPNTTPSVWPDPTPKFQVRQGP